MDPFTNNYKHTENGFKVKIPLTITPLEEFTYKPVTVTLGDHLRRRRIELGLFQKDVATKLGVTASTIWNWEHGWEIGKRFIPRIIQFLEQNSCLATTEKSIER